MRLATPALCLLIATPAWAAAPRLPLGVFVVLPDTPRDDPTAAQPAPGQDIVQDILRGPPAPNGLLGGGAAPRPVVLPVLPDIPPEPRDANWPPPDDTIEVEQLAPPASELGG